MTAPSLTQVFGANATQTSTTITISKADLATATGLTPSATNTADSLFVAVLLQAATALNSTAQGTNNDIDVTIDDSGYQNLVSRNSLTFRQVTYNVNLQTVDSGFTVNPNNY